MKIVSNYIEGASGAIELGRLRQALVISSFWFLFILGLSFYSGNFLFNQVESNDQIEFADSDQDVLQDTKYTLSVNIPRNGVLLREVLLKKNLDSSQVKDIEKLLKQNKISTSLSRDDKIMAEVMVADPENGDSINNLQIYHSASSKLVRISKLEDSGPLVISISKLKLLPEMIKVQADIKGSVFESLKKLGIPSNKANALVRMYSEQINFTKDLRAGDYIELIIEKLSTEDREVSYFGDIVFARLSSKGKNMDLYRYQNGKMHEYFLADGSSYKKALLSAVPVKGAKISSKFGRRIHPIHGRHCMHNGVDYAIKSGSPIYATGDGVVTFLGRQGGYGNLVQIRHTRSLSTVYAHVSKFSPSLKVGSTVKQGSLIAYVGSTGTASGPHLHYEVRLEGRPVNPLSVRTIQSQALAGAELKKFFAYQTKIHKLARTPEGVAVQQAAKSVAAESAS